MSEFEDFIKKNRAELDTEDLSSTSWNAIENRLNNKIGFTKKRRNLSIAATLLLCFALGFAISQFTTNKNHEVTATDFYKYAPELAFADQTYTPVILQTLSEITDNPEYATDTAYFGVFIQQFNRLKKQNEQYLEELRKNGYSAPIVEELIKNYSYRLELLKDLQREIRKYNHQLKTIGYEKQTNYIAI